MSRELQPYFYLQVDCANFEEASWFESLMFYGYQEGHTQHSDDADIKLMPSLIEKVLLPKLTGIHILSLLSTRRLVIFSFLVQQ